MLIVIRNGQRCEVSREVEAQGAAAVEAFVTKQHGPPEKPAAALPAADRNAGSSGDTASKRIGRGTPAAPSLSSTSTPEA